MSRGCEKTSAFVAGTKTGGHLYPALAVGRELAARGVDVTIIASGAETEQTVLKGADLPVEVLEVGRLKGAGSWAKVRSLVSIPVGIARAVALIRRMRPDIVVGFGGFTTGPLLLAAALMGVPTAICEENSIPGLTNRILARFVTRVFVAFEETLETLPCSRGEVTGTPIRPEILAVSYVGNRPGISRVLVFGGSQGSAFLNREMPGVMSMVAQSVGGLEIIHQTGLGRDSAVRDEYESLGIKADVREYLHSMAEAYAWADFAVSRSGAGTIAEISAIGLPALLVPFGAAADNHQVANARPLVRAEAAYMVEEREFERDEVAGLIKETISNPERLQAMSRAARSIGRTDALEMIASRLMTMVAA